MAKVPELEGLKRRLASLEQTIRDEQTRKQLLELAKQWIGDIERGVPRGPGIAFLVALAEQQVSWAERVVEKNGPGIRIVRG